MCTMKASEPSWVTNDESLRLRMVIDSAPALIHTARPDGYIDFFNQTWLDFIGQPLDKMLGWKWTSWIHPEDLEVLLRKRRESLATGDRFEEEARVLRADGEYRWMIHCAVSQRDAHGNVVEWFGASIDIEDRKRAEEALRQSEAYLAEGQRLVHAGSWALDVANNKYVYVSEEDLRIWGFDPGTSPTREEVFQRLLLEDRSKVEASLQKAIREKADTEYEYRIMLPDGTVKHIHTIRHPVLNGAGDVVQLFGTSVDITERKQAEEKIRQSEECLRLTLEATQIGTFDWDVAHDVWYASPIYYTALGYEPREGPGSRAEWVDRLHPDDRDPFARLTHDILTGESDQYEYDARLRHANGSYRWVHVKATGVEHGPDGKVTDVLQVPSMIGAKQEGAKMRPRALGPGIAGNHKLILLMYLELQPSPGAPFDVWRSKVFCYYSLVAFSFRFTERKKTIRVHALRLEK